MSVGNQALAADLHALQDGLLHDAIPDGLGKIVGHDGVPEQLVLLEANLRGTDLRALLGLRGGAGLLDRAPHVAALGLYAGDPGVDRRTV